MKENLKLLLRLIEDTLVPVVAIVAIIVGPLWILYKILAGVYHLLILLINKS